MKIKRVNSYAMHALMYMVRHITQQPLTLQMISKAEKIPYRQLVHLFHVLSDAGILTTSEQGGVVFKKPPSEVTLLEVFEMIEGEPIFQGCFMDHCDCKATPENCRIYTAWRKATASVAKQLSEITIETAAWGHPEHYF